MGERAIRRVAESLVVVALERGHSIDWKPTGKSMWPWIWSGWTITVTPVSACWVEAVKRGTVVLTYSVEHGIEQVHRIIGRDSLGRLRTRGDTLSTPDPPATKGTRYAVVNHVRIRCGMGYSPNQIPWRFLGLASGKVLPKLRGAVARLMMRR